jgi:hypothetical protein
MRRIDRLIADHTLRATMPRFGLKGGGGAMKTAHLTDKEATELVYSDLDTLRSHTHLLVAACKQAEKSAWIRCASRKQLLAEIIKLYSNNAVGAAEQPF